MVSMSLDSTFFLIQYAWSALHWACDCGHTDIVDYLLDHRADADAQDVRIASLAIPCCYCVAFISQKVGQASFWPVGGDT